MPAAKPADEQRTYRPNPRYTHAEELAIRRHAAMAGLTPAAYVREQSLGAEVRAPVRGRADPALITEINSLALQLKYAGVTANKLAIATHMERDFRGRWQDVADDIDAARAAAAELLERLVLLT